MVYKSTSSVTFGFSGEKKKEKRRVGFSAVFAVRTGRVDEKKKNRITTVVFRYRLKCRLMSVKMSSAHNSIAYRYPFERIAPCTRGLFPISYYRHNNIGGRLNYRRRAHNGKTVTAFAAGREILILRSDTHFNIRPAPHNTHVVVDYWISYLPRRRRHATE